LPNPELPVAKYPPGRFIAELDFGNGALGNVHQITDRPGVINVGKCGGMKNIHGRNVVL
jgi:hypothetical protein